MDSSPDEYCTGRLSAFRMGGLKQPLHRTITRRADEPKLEIGDKIPIEEGVIGVVLARYIPTGKKNQICYIVELLSNGGDEGTS
jgi:hypothetical protein